MSILLLSCNNIHIQPGGPVSSTSLALWWPLLNKDSPRALSSKVFPNSFSLSGMLSNVPDKSGAAWAGAGPSKVMATTTIRTGRAMKSLILVGGAPWI